MKNVLICTLVLMTGGCATSFTGSAHINKADCASKCSQWGMILIGMVAMGDYSDACVCKAASGSANNKSDTDLLMSAGPTAAGSAGVMMQTRRRDEEARRGMMR